MDDKNKLTEEINELHIDGMPKLDKLNALVGKYVNSDKIYFIGNQPA